MRSKFGIRCKAWATFSLPAVALAGLIAGCDSGGGADSPEVKQTVQVQQKDMDKMEEQANAAAKKGGANAPQVKFHRKPGAVGGN